MANTGKFVKLVKKLSSRLSSVENYRCLRQSLPILEPILGVK